MRHAREGGGRGGVEREMCIEQEGRLCTWNRIHLDLLWS